MEELFPWGIRCTYSVTLCSSSAARDYIELDSGVLMDDGSKG